MDWSARLAEKREKFSECSGDKVPKVTKGDSGTFGTDPNDHFQNIAPGKQDKPEAARRPASKGTPCSDAELKRRCEAACDGLPIKPKALYKAMTAEGRAAQCRGEEGREVLRAYARSLAERAKPALAPGIAAAYARLKRELAEHPSLKTAVETWGADADPVLLAVAVRGAGYATLRIPKARYDGFKLLEIVHRWNSAGEPQEASA